MATDDRNLPRDSTPIVEAGTGIARVTNGGLNPAHERTAHEVVDIANWQKIADSGKFKELIKAKRRFILPATVFFVLYYFALPYLVGYHPQFMQRKIWGEMNLAYLFALSQFFMAWIIAGLYVRAAARFDRMAAGVIENEPG